MKTKNKNLRIFVVCIRISFFFMFFIIAEHTVTAQSNPFGANEDYDITKNDLIPDTISPCEIYEYAGFLDFYRPTEYPSTFVILGSLLSDQEFVFQLKGNSSKKQWVKIKLPIKQKYFVSDVAFIKDTLLPKAICRIECILDKNNPNFNKVFLIDLYENDQVIKEEEK